MQVSAYMHRLVRRSTSPVRQLPGLLVIGGARCGTSSFFNWLSSHPDLGPSVAKEIHFFNWYFDRGLNWYRAFFPIRTSGVTTYEATPNYMTSAGAAERAAATVPEARIVALLRDPVERAWSHYRLRKATDRENRSFAEAISEELAASPPAMLSQRPYERVPYVTGGLYAEQLAPWFAAFGRNRVMVVDADEMFSDPAPTITELERFLGIRQIELTAGRENAAPEETPDVETMERLSQFYRKPNQLLLDAVDIPISWAR